MREVDCMCIVTIISVILFNLFLTFSKGTNKNFFLSLQFFGCLGILISIFLLLCDARLTITSMLMYIISIAGFILFIIRVGAKSKKCRSDKKSFCDYCGMEVKQDSKFCSKCGNPYKKQSEEIKK